MAESEIEISHDDEDEESVELEIANTARQSILNMDFR